MAHEHLGATFRHGESSIGSSCRTNAPKSFRHGESAIADQPALPAARHPGGAPQVYGDETILLTMLVLRAWRLSLEKIANWLPRYTALAEALRHGESTMGMPPGGPTISAAQLSRRSRQLGVWPYFFFFVALVWQLLRVGALSGRRVILDGSLLKAWYRRDPDATLAGRRHSPAAIVDSPLERRRFAVAKSTTSVHEVVMAPLVLVAAVVFYGLRVSVAYADSAYFSAAFLGLVRKLGAIPIIDYNLRRKGKRFLAMLFFVDQWRPSQRICDRLRAPRAVIERCFAFLKRYYGLKYFQVQGLPAVWCHALLVHAAWGC